MPVEFQNSETLRNLMRAFAGESQARSRYAFAAALCHQQKQPALEAVFRFTADQELAHAKIFYDHMKTLSGQSVSMDGSYPINHTNSALELLQMARHNEYEEYSSVYPAFSQTAREEGFADVAASFQQIAAIEKTHGDRFGALAELLERRALFASDTACGWMCLNCGHIHQGTSAPETCPVCRHPQGFLIRLETAPFAGPLLKG